MPVRIIFDNAATRKPEGEFLSVLNVGRYEGLKALIEEDLKAIEDDLKAEDGEVKIVINDTFMNFAFDNISEQLQEKILAAIPTKTAG